MNYSMQDAAFLKKLRIEPVTEEVMLEPDSECNECPIVVSLDEYMKLRDENDALTLKAIAALSLKEDACNRATKLAKWLWYVGAVAVGMTLVVLIDWWRWHR